MHRELSSIGAELMKSIVTAVMAGVVASTLVAPAFAAQVIRGVIAPGRTPVELNVKLPARPGPMTLRFAAPRPSVNPDVRYALNFCIGPRANPCGSPSAKVINVTEGGQKAATFSSRIFATNILVVSQGTRVPVPYAVSITP
jgi:hypothetical protein